MKNNKIFVFKTLDELCKDCLYIFVFNLIIQLIQLWKNSLLYFKKVSEIFNVEEESPTFSSFFQVLCPTLSSFIKFSLSYIPKNNSGSLNCKSIFN